MTRLEREIRKTFFELFETRRLRMWLERVWHPEKLRWNKREGPPPLSEVALVRREVLQELGFGEAFYQEIKEREEEAKKRLCELAQEHPLWEHWRRIKGLGPYLCGCFIAAAGDIERTPTVSSFWKGMGLDVLPDGTVPRKKRGAKGEGRRIPCFPHVSAVGEQIRMQILMSDGKLRELYEMARKKWEAKDPDRKPILKHKAAIREVQKLLYAVSWMAWREALGLEAPKPYAFDILKHNGKLYTIEDLYDE